METIRATRIVSETETVIGRETISETEKNQQIKQLQQPQRFKK
jgi:hypothetical protein